MRDGWCKENICERSGLVTTIQSLEQENAKLRQALENIAGYRSRLDQKGMVDIYLESCVEYAESAIRGEEKGK